MVETAQQLPPGRDVLPENNVPIGLRARRMRLPKGMDGTAFLVPFDSSTGAAAFRSGDSTYVVFDERRPVDLAGLKDDPVFGTATVKLLPTGTLLRLPQRPGLSITLTQLQQGWRIAALTGSLKQEPIVASEVDGRLDAGGRTAQRRRGMADPDTGATLLVGTQRRPGQGVSFSRRSMEFILRPTSQGVVVEPLSDTIALKLAPNGFSLSSARSGLALSKPTVTTRALMDAAHLTRRLNFSTMPKEALLRLAVKQLNDAAATPPLARGPKHHAAAETFLALGLSVEAESLLHMASDQDPKEAASPDTKALTAIAALLAGRPEDSIGLMDPKLDGTDEIALWRAVRLAMQDEGSPEGRGGIRRHGAAGISVSGNDQRPHSAADGRDDDPGRGDRARGRSAGAAAGGSEIGLCAGAAAPGRGRRRQGPGAVRRASPMGMTSLTARGQRSERWNYGWRRGRWTRPRRRMRWTSCCIAWRGDFARTGVAPADR